MGTKEILKEILQYNDAFVRSHGAQDFAPYQSAQHPFLTLVTCADARIQTEVLLPGAIDKIFVIRNIGNQIVNAQGSVDYGVLHLRTPILLILGHTGCGAIKAAMGDYSNETFGIISELDHLHLPLNREEKEESFDTLWLKNTESNIHYQVEWALKCYKEKVTSGELTIIGAIYDFMNIYRKGFGRVIIINLNGEKDPHIIKDHHLLTDINKEILKLCTL